MASDAWITSVIKSHVFYSVFSVMILLDTSYTVFHATSCTVYQWPSKGSPITNYVISIFVVEIPEFLRNVPGAIGTSAVMHLNIFVVETALSPNNMCNDESIQVHIAESCAMATMSHLAESCIKAALF